MKTAEGQDAGRLPVLELSAAIGPAGVAGRLLADWGAQVTRIEFDGPGEPPASRGITLLRSGKILVSADHLEGALQAAAIVLVDRSDLADAIVRQAPAGALVCTITPFGRDGGQRGGPGSEIALQACTGLASVTGFPGDPPSCIPAPLITHLAGIMAAMAVLAALRMPPASRPRTLDVAAFDAMFMNFGTRLANFLEKGTDEGRQGNRYWMAAPFTLYAAKDGHVMVCVFSDRQWNDLLQVIGRSDLAGDLRFADNRARCVHWQLVDEIVGGWIAPHTVEHTVAVLSAAEIPAGPVFSPRQVVEDRLLVERGIVAWQDGCLAIRSPVHSSGLGPGALAEWHLRRGAGGRGSPGNHSASSTAPLAGIRVLEIGLLTAAPFAGRLLADLGAEVIKLEVPGRGDTARAVGAPIDDAGGIYFHTSCAGKRSIALDLRDAAQLAVALELAATVDIVLENLGPGVLERWGFGATVLRHNNPSLIRCSVSGFGRRGPGVNLRAYDGLIQARSGLMHLVRRPGRPPTKVGISIADQLGPMFAATAMIAALAQRDRTGAGCDLDIAMYDVLAWILADPLLAASAGEGPAPIGAIAPSANGFAAFADPQDRYWPSAGACEPGAGTRCMELADVVASERVRKAGLIQVTERRGVRIPQVGSATGFPAPAAMVRGLAPFLNELGDDRDALAALLADGQRRQAAGNNVAEPGVYATENT